MNAYPPRDVIILLRIEGAVVLLAALAAYGALDGNWWLFALLLLAPDLSMLAGLAGRTVGSRVYNLAHLYAFPLLIGGLAWFSSAVWLVPYMLIWIAHIAMDRAVGYGLKYAGQFHATHLGPIGRKGHGDPLANAG